jgi:hypothetical protein
MHYLLDDLTRLLEKGDRLVSEKPLKNKGRQR